MSKKIYAARRFISGKLQQLCINYDYCNYLNNEQYSRFLDKYNYLEDVSDTEIMKCAQDIINGSDLDELDDYMGTVARVMQDIANYCLQTYYVVREGENEKSICGESDKRAPRRYEIV